MRKQNRELLFIPRGNNFKTLKIIDKIAKEEQKHPFIKQAVQKYKLDQSPESIERIFKAIYKLIKFYPDPANTQYIRTVNRQLKDKRGNCVDYTLFLTSFLRALGVPHSIRMVQTDKHASGFNHIYIVLDNGTPLDLVIGQDQNGLEPLKEKRNAPMMGIQVPFERKYDKRII
jgi:hypothetical protein